MKKPTTLIEAEILLKSGKLRHTLILQIIIIAFSNEGAVALKAALELLLMPDQKTDDWTDDLSTQELLHVDEYLLELKEEIDALFSDV